MIKITSSIERILERTEYVLRLKWERESNETEKIYKEKRYKEFQNLRKEIENGTNVNVLQPDNWKSRIQLFRVITEYWQGFSKGEVSYIKDFIFKSRKLENEIKKLMKDSNTRFEAKYILFFIRDARNSCWSYIDENAEVKYFKLVQSLRTFSRIVNEGVQDVITPENTSEYLPLKKLRLALKYEQVDENLYKKKGVYEEFRKFCIELEELLKETGNEIEQYDYDVFNLWNNLRNTATYYIFIPNS